MKQCHNSIKSQTYSPVKRCLACGRVLEKNQLRYCSPDCKEQFQFKLKWFNNLLRAISTKYASFLFTEDYLILNVLPHNTQTVHTYFHRRTPGRKPAQDMNQMIFDLGELWWDQMKTHRSRNMAMQTILDSGQTNIFPRDRVIPMEKIQFSHISKQMFLLEVDKTELLQQDYAEEVIKTAFRKAARKHHPDLGGDADRFRRAYQAYKDLLRWLNHSHIKTRRGIPGQWCYLGRNNAWIKPL